MLSLLRKLPGARKDTFNERHKEDLRDIEIKGKSKIMYKTLNVLCLGVAVLFSIRMFAHKAEVRPMAGGGSRRKLVQNAEIFPTRMPSSGAASILPWQKKISPAAARTIPRDPASFRLWIN